MIPLTVVIIGGSSSIGKAISLKFAEGGGAVIVAGKDEKAGAKLAGMIRARGANGHFITYESSPQSAQALLNKCQQLVGGPPDILVNCASPIQDFMHKQDSHLDLAMAPWESCYTSAQLACQVFGDQMSSAGKGCILNIGSLESLAPLPFLRRADNKTSIFALTQMLAIDLGPFGVRVNGIAPCCSLTDDLKTIAERGWHSSTEARLNIPLLITVQPEQVANAAYFLCSDKAASITGAMLPIDAGRLLHTAHVPNTPAKNA